MEFLCPEESEEHGREAMPVVVQTWSSLMATGVLDLSAPRTDGTAHARKIPRRRPLPPDAISTHTHRDFAHVSGQSLL